LDQSWLAFFLGSALPIFILVALLFGVPFGLLLTLVFFGVALPALALVLSVGSEALVAGSPLTLCHGACPSRVFHASVASR
jgi:hypothetical protein